MKYFSNDQQTSKIQMTPYTSYMTIIIYKFWNERMNEDFFFEFQTLFLKQNVKISLKHSVLEANLRRFLWHSCTILVKNDNVP